MHSCFPEVLEIYVTHYITILHLYISRFFRSLLESQRSACPKSCYAVIPYINCTLTTCFDNKHSQKCSLFFCSKQKYISACGQYSTLITLDLCISSAGLQKSNTIAIHPKVRCISNVSWSPLINAF